MGQLPVAQHTSDGLAVDQDEYDPLISRDEVIVILRNLSCAVMNAREQNRMSVVAPMVIGALFCRWGQGGIGTGADESRVRRNSDREPEVVYFGALIIGRKDVKLL